MRVIAGQTMMARHGAEGECGKEACFYCPEVAMKRLLAGATLDQFFATFRLVEH